MLGDRTAADVAAEDPAFDRVQARAIEAKDLIEDAFGALARSGAAQFEVLVRLQKSLNLLAGSEQAPLAEAARLMSVTVADLAETTLTLAEDRARIRALAAPTAH